MTGHDRFASQLSDWYRAEVRPLLAEHRAERIPELDADVDRIEVLRAGCRTELPVCFLGNSGVGKSTLLNALVDSRRAILPQGGVGPLTAQRTSVRHAEAPYFRATYLAASKVNQVLFALERDREREQRSGGIAENGPQLEMPDGALDDDGRFEVEAAASEADGTEVMGAETKIEGYKRQARLLIRGGQFEDGDVPYLVHGLRVALGMPSAERVTLRADDEARTHDVREALRVARSGKNSVEFQLEGDTEAFLETLRKHAAGHLAPLIKTIDVGWNAEILRTGLVLVDLPGVGVANDEYRQVTTEAIRTARAIVLVVDRSGVSEASAQLLEDVGFLTSLLHDSHDPEAELARLVVAVVKLDLSADDSRRDERERKPVSSARKFLEHLNEAFTRADTLVRGQIREELQKIIARGGDLTREDRQGVVERVLSQLEVHTVSALEFRRLHLEDEEDRPRILDPEDSRIPAFGRFLASMADATTRQAESRFRDHVEVVARKLEGTLVLIRDYCRDDRQVTQAVDQLRLELDIRMAPLRNELNVRKASFRVFLRETIPEKIKAQVAEASNAARADIARFLRRFDEYHWKTLQATVRRGGAFIGSRRVDLPNDLTLRFEEPVAVVWSREILAALRRRTREFGEDHVELQADLVAWARDQGARVRLKVVEALHEELRGNVKQFADVGKEAIDELKARVKNELYSKVEAAVRRKCQRFVDERRDYGVGVRRRILDLFDELSDAVVDVAKPAAEKVLKDNYEDVEQDIQGVLRKLPDPLEAVAEVIVSSRLKENDKERRRLLEKSEIALQAIPRLEA